MKLKNLFCTSTLIAFLLASVSADDQKTEFKPAEESGWELVFEDTFDRDELGDDWEIIDGAWELKNGDLVGSGTMISTMGFPKRHLLGFQRLEMVVESSVKPFLKIPGRPDPKVELSDFDLMIHARDPEAVDGKVIPNSYFFQFGGFYNTRNQLRKNGETIVSDLEPEILIDQDKVHHIVAENDEGTLRLFVDGELVYEFEERTSIMGKGFDRFGFYILTAARIESIKLYVKKLPDDLDLG